MFCGECGAKNEKDAAFCCECGAKLRRVESTKEKKTGVSKKKVEVKSKKTNDIIDKIKKLDVKIKALVVVCLVLVVSFTVYYNNLKKEASPEKLVQDYLTAINMQDYETIYKITGSSYVSKYVSKDDYISTLETKIDEKNKLGIVNVGKAIKEVGGKSVTVPFTISNYTNKDNSELKFTLVKSDEKANLFFHKYVLTDTMLLKIDLVKEYKIFTPEGTTVKFNGIDVKDKCSENNSDSNCVSVKNILPGKEVALDFTLSNGIKLNKKVKIGLSSSNYTLSVDKSDFTSSEQEKIIAKAKSDMELLGTSIVARKKFSEIIDKFAPKTETELGKLRDSYNETVDRISTNYTYSDFVISNCNLRSISLKDGKFKVYMYYRYTYNYKRTDGDRAYDSYGNLYVNLTYDYDSKNGYQLVEVDSLPSFY